MSSSRLAPSVVACVAAALAAGCQGGGISTVNGSGDLSITADLAVDCVKDPAACVCTGDTQCGGATPRCDRNAGHCVACLPQDDNCPSGQRCISSQGSFSCAAGCVADSDCPLADGGAPPVCCDGKCVDIGADAHNCGGCGRGCPAPPNAAAACSAGACTLGACNPGFLDCDRRHEDGCEIDGAGDVQNCGGCGNRCTAGPHQSVACTNGGCEARCAAGYSHCSPDPADGCEVHSDVDTRNCGGCGLACDPPAHGVAGCSAGACSVQSCAAGFGDCNLLPRDGCESDLATDARNCGACGRECPVVPNGAGVCRNGACLTESCLPGFGDCDGLAKNGCETPTEGDPMNCGACFHVCAAPNSVQGCGGGLCTVAKCSPGFADCDKQPGDGCEINVTSDVMSCGGCGNACAAVANGQVACAGGGCVVGSCNFGFGDCNKDVKDGCEASLLSLKDCGSCGNACAAPANGTAACKAGVCGLGMCAAMWGDCDGNPGNGCEKSVAADVSNCGSCGNACSLANATASCVNGACSVAACKAGFSDCDMQAANGCEVGLGGDPKNCGACGKVCPQNTPVCVDSVCGDVSHNLGQLAPDFNTGNYQSCGDNSNWWSQNFGAMTYDQCEALANRYGAQYMGETGFFNNYAAPYQYTTRWVGEADATNGWLGTGSWSVINLAPKNQQQLCVLAYANASVPGKSTFITTMTSANGRTYQVRDYGVISEMTCYTNALAAGARPLNPYLFANATKGTAHMVENHQNHGSAEYTGLSTYTVDGNCNHSYRCLVGYNP